MVTELLLSMSGTMTWFSHLRPCVVSLTFITNELIPWHLTSTSISHFAQIDIILIYHFQIYSDGKLPWLEQKEEEEVKEEHTGFSKILSDLLGIFQDWNFYTGFSKILSDPGPGQAKLCSDQDKRRKRGQTCSDILPNLPKSPDPAICS